MYPPGSQANQRTFRIAAVLIFALSSAVAIFAKFYIEPGAAISQTNEAAVIKVTAMGRDDLYDTVSPGNLDFHVKVRGSCDPGWHVQSARVEIDSEQGAQKTHYLVVNNSLRTIGYDNGEKWSFQLATIPYIPPDTQSSPVAMCNAEVEQRLARGDSKTDVLGKGFELSAQQGYSAQLIVSCGRKKNGFYETDRFWADTKLPVTISCQPTGYKAERTPGAPKRTPGAPKRTPAPPGRLPVPPAPIGSVSVVADPAATTGRQCPVYVNFRGKIEAGEETPYQTFNTKYRFIGDNGYQTDWIFVSVSRNTPRTVNGRRFIQAPANDPDATIAIGPKRRIPLYQGWMELEVQLPNGSKKSERANFTVDCNAAPARSRTKASNDNEPSQSGANINGGRGTDKIFNASNGSTGSTDSGAAEDKKAPLGQPDLSISQFLFPPSNDKALRVHVINTGQGPSTACRLVLTVREINGVAVGRTIHVNVPALPAGADAWLHMDAKSILPNNIALESTAFRLNVDATQIVAESNEANNEARHKLSPRT